MNRRSKQGFTLIELLVVIAIIAILAAILFPVFAQARAKARQATCTSNFKQQSLGIIMYTQDYDENMPLYLTYGSFVSPPDTIWPMLVQPYLKNLQIYNCPSDPANDTQRATVKVPAPTTPEQRVFNLAVKNNFAYNWQYLCPLVVGGRTNALSVPTSIAAIGAPAQTILGVDSVWGRDAGGTPYGGGNDAADPPCRLYSDGSDSFPVQRNYPGFYQFGAWNPSSPLAWNVFGGTWPWHTNLVTTAFTDGHIKALSIGALSAGCVMKDGWGGPITNPDTYLWDLR